jgi:LysM repeat protein
MKEKYYNSAKDIYKDFIKGDNLINENDEQKEKNGNEKLVEISNNPQYTNGIAAEIVNGIWGNNWRESLILKIEETIEGLGSIVNKPEQYYKVVAGDTLTKIANRFNTTVERIINDNSVVYPAIAKSYLNVGWILKI